MLVVKEAQDTLCEKACVWRRSRCSLALGSEKLKAPLRSALVFGRRVNGAVAGAGCGEAGHRAGAREQLPKACGHASSSAVRCPRGSPPPRDTRVPAEVVLGGGSCSSEPSTVVGSRRAGQSPFGGVRWLGAGTDVLWCVCSVGRLLGSCALGSRACAAECDPQVQLRRLQNTFI